MLIVVGKIDLRVPQQLLDLLFQAVQRCCLLQNEQLLIPVKLADRTRLLHDLGDIIQSYALILERRFSVDSALIVDRIADHLVQSLFLCQEHVSGFREAIDRHCKERCRIFTLLIHKRQHIDEVQLGFLRQLLRGVCRQDSCAAQNNCKQ